MSLNHIADTRRELAHRSNNGIHVHLLWSPADDSLAVTVLEDAGDSFELAVDAAEGLDVFNHPYAYAAFRGSPRECARGRLRYEARLRAPCAARSARFGERRGR